MVAVASAGIAAQKSFAGGSPRYANHQSRDHDRSHRGAQLRRICWRKFNGKYGQLPWSNADDVERVADHVARAGRQIRGTFATAASIGVLVRGVGVLGSRTGRFFTAQHAGRWNNGVGRLSGSSHGSLANAHSHNEYVGNWLGATPGDFRWSRNVAVGRRNGRHHRQLMAR